jgi:hypothetical protein
MKQIVDELFAKYEITSAKASEGVIKGQTLVILSRGMLLAFLMPHEETLLGHDAICAEAFIDPAAI